MQQPIVYFAILLLFSAACSRLIALPQAMRINKELARIRKTGELCSVGLSKHWYGSRVYVLIADRDGVIKSGHVLKGTTIFSGFTPDADLRERTAREILDAVGQKKKLTRVDRAKQMAAGYLEKGLPVEEEPAQGALPAGEGAA